MRCQLVCLLAAVAVMPGASASADSCRTTAAAPGSARAVAEAERLVPRLQEGLHAPGLSIAVAVRGRVLWAATCGYADLATRRPVTDTSEFRVGSVSKTLTAAAMIRLASRGTISLDAPISRYLPRFPRPRGITLRRLAGHLAGIRHYESPSEVVNTRHFDSVTASLSLFENDPRVARPGTRFVYSSYGYDVIGAALESVTHESFRRVLNDAVLRPLGLAHTHFEAAGTTYYELNDDGTVRIAPRADLSDRLPAGAVTTTARDLARFGSLLAVNALAQPRWTRQLFRQQITTSGAPTGYGLGFEVRPSPFGVFADAIGSVVGGGGAILIHVATGTTLALAVNVGTVTASAPPPPSPDTPDPPQLLLPFIAH
jgi:serine beta-lactamase-like protein LACTB, mitochondrial